LRRESEYTITCKELISSCLRQYATAFDKRPKKGLQQLLSIMRENEGKLLDRPVRPICTHLVGIQEQPAFQAGCRGFESRLPLFFYSRCSQSASQAGSQEASSDDK
jgi:hypothetical protein